MDQQAQCPRHHSKSKGSKTYKGKKITRGTEEKISIAVFFFKILFANKRIDEKKLCLPGLSRPHYMRL